jgi:hypothetical protein
MSSTVHDKDITIEVRTPSNAPHDFTIKASSRVDKLAREAVKHFVGQGLLADGEYGLALVRDGVATPLDDASRLDEDDVVDGDVLALVAKKPKVDG